MSTKRQRLWDLLWADEYSEKLQLAGARGKEYTVSFSPLKSC